MSYWVKSKKWMHWLFPYCVWKIKTTEKKVYLTFDDGPTPLITEWVLEQLKMYNAKATFFCLGNNIYKHSEIFQRVINEQHCVGNHTLNHLNGWKTSTKKYVENAKLCQTEINNHLSSSSNLFRPPYGKISPFQSWQLRKMGYKIILWDILSRDFDASISNDQCLENVLHNIENGSIIVFHDSKKAWKHLEYVLPKVLEYLKKNGFACDKLH